MTYYKILTILIIFFLTTIQTMANIHNISDSTLTQKPLEEINDSASPLGIPRDLASKRSTLYSNIKYSLFFKLQPKTEAIYGKVKIDLKIKNPLEALILDFKSPGNSLEKTDGKLKNQAILVNGKPISNFKQLNGHLIIPKEAILEGQNSLEIEFETVAEKSGAAITRYLDSDDNSEYIYTLFVPSDAHMAFPCFDQPDLKAQFTLSLESPENWELVSNTPIENTSKISEDSKIVKFQETKPLSTYLFAFAAGDFAKLKIENSKIPMQIFVRKSKLEKAKAEFNEIARINREGFEVLAEYFDYAYPFGKCDLVILPEFAYGGMEHAGSIFFREDRMLFPNEPSPNELLNRASLILHEAAHQWFGNLVTMRWFDDLWLKEGFATFMAYRAMEKVFPSNVWKNFYQSNKPRAYSTDSTKGTTAIFQEIPNLKDAKSAYGNIVYTKAPSVLRQLEFYIGKEVFQKGVQLFLKKHQFSNAEWSELINSYEVAAGYSLKSWANAWVKNRAMAVIEPEIEIKEGKITNFKITQNNILGEETTWPIKTKLLLGYRNTPPKIITVTLSGQTNQINELLGTPKPDYIFTNYEDFGYGQFRLDKESLTYVKTNLASISDDFLRALLWGAMWDAVREAKLPPIEYLELVSNSLAKEEDPITVQQILSNSSTAFASYLSTKQQSEIALKLETLLFDQLLKEKNKGLKLTYFRALPSLVSSESGRKKLIDLLSGLLSFEGITLKSKDRWDIITSLIAQNDPQAENLFLAEQKLDLSVDAKRYAFTANAAKNDKEVKKAYFKRYLEDKDLAENWIETSLRAFNSANQTDLTLIYLEDSLKALPQLKRQRKIFFINEWLAAFIGGQNSLEALKIVEKYLQENNLDKDLKLKILEATDKLERAATIRNKVK
jgi:aminopeptidase N